MPGTCEIPTHLTVNDAVQRWPESVAVFNDFGVDACCGGALPIHEAAVRAGADPGAVCAALLRVIRGVLA